MRKIFALLIVIATATTAYFVGYVDAFRRQENYGAIMGRMTQLHRARQLLRFVQGLDAGDGAAVRQKMTEYASTQVESNWFTANTNRHLPTGEILIDLVWPRAIAKLLDEQATLNGKEETALNDLLRSICAAPLSSSADYNVVCRR